MAQFSLHHMDSESDTHHKKREEDCLEDNFKPVFKRYKSRVTNLDLSEVVDFRLVDVCRRFGASKNQVKANVGAGICSGLGLRPPQEWNSFSLEAAPGFIVVCNPFKHGRQRYWLKRLLQDVPSNPANKTNLPEGRLSSERESIWNLHRQRSTTATKKSAFSQLRWVTLGYHYNWNTKLYDPQDLAPFPEDVGVLSSFVATSLGFGTFSAEAAIVSYYEMNSTLSGHNDHSELDHGAPLVCFSFGQSAIFLVGGLTKAVKPTPILLRSGDIIILSSSSRLAFHGVPRILHDNPENLKLCWGINEGIEWMKDDKQRQIPTLRGEQDDIDTRQPGKLNVKGRPTTDASRCGVEEGGVVMKTETLIQGNNEIVENNESGKNNEGRENNGSGENNRQKEDELSCLRPSSSAINNFNKGKDKFQIDRCEDFQESKDGQLTASLRDNGDHQFGVRTSGITGTLPERSKEGRDGEMINLEHYQSTVDRLVIDDSFWIKFPNLDRILQRITDETVSLSQSSAWEPFEEHLRNARLSVSVRQVNVKVCIAD